ncbi:uncharacterized protein SEPMUDRAFT_151430 [Sphaerulina musiva SO2202]|uniref:Uncharacterized protein n=1 Tax=Sphaerulina musiva (strain SO2202) TaxID=692275 RepID=N1QEI9_SPHMS|nr:uncharacterized protein SEPMUDRAFT_151430 [Sphaerulina musiva SO2202]EMF09392.1 hypothetical protein SEPMUDRAFT_151430 [Sphaerulina musiva SO2202]
MTDCTDPTSGSRTVLDPDLMKEESLLQRRMHKHVSMRCWHDWWQHELSNMPYPSSWRYTFLQKEHEWPDIHHALPSSISSESQTPWVPGGAAKRTNNVVREAGPLCTPYCEPVSASRCHTHP